MANRLALHHTGIQFTYSFRPMSRRQRNGVARNRIVFGRTDQYGGEKLTLECSQLCPTTFDVQFDNPRADPNHLAETWANQEWRAFIARIESFLRNNLTTDR
jgi:hypothetical protein